MRKLQSYIARYGPEIGPKLYRTLQSQAAHAGVAARLRRRIATLNERAARSLPLFPEATAGPVAAGVSPVDAPPSPPDGR